jgi:GalNAc-alpha-(1->4)-GalNAc-alpha-(1->3)-diNAcBac-PP-undecaprenol alpha-1,4-N-acetyl-D-galactosaminyltransferase
MERVIYELAVYFCKKNELEINLVLYGKSPEIFYDLPENIIIHKPRTVFNNRCRFLFTLNRFIYLRQTIKKINPSSILSFGEYWNSFVLLAVWGLPYKVYLSDRCSPDKKFSLIHSVLRKWLYPRAKGIIAQTDKAKYLYGSQLKNKNICVIGNPIRILPSSEIIIKKERIVLSVGRLIESKNHDKLIKLFCEINKPGWKLVIVGGDALNQKNMSGLINLISSLKAERKVVLPGYTNDLTSYYLKSRVFVFTSESEGFPNVIGEAMSAGLPVVSFDCVAGPSEMIKDGEDGFLVPVHDYSLFRERLELLMEDEQLGNQMGIKARESIQKFAVNNIGEQYYNFIIEH